MSWFALVSAASLYATWLNIKRRRMCFAVWMVTNALWVFSDVLTHNYARAPLDAAYCGLAVWGWFKWR